MSMCPQKSKPFTTLDSHSSKPKAWHSPICIKNHIINKQYRTIQIKKLSSHMGVSHSITSLAAEKGRKDILRRMKVLFLMRNMDVNHVYQGLYVALQKSRKIGNKSIMYILL